jgi:hypothetical protein
MCAAKQSVRLSAAPGGKMDVNIDMASVNTNTTTKYKHETRRNWRPLRPAPEAGLTVLPVFNCGCH